MKEFGQKLIAAGILLALGYVVYLEVLQPQSSMIPSDSAQFTLEDSKRLYRDLGGSSDSQPIIIFVTDWCGICRALESQMKQIGIPFARANIDEDRKALIYYESLTRGKGTGVPLTVVGTKIFHGYTPLIFQAIKNLYQSDPMV